MVPLGVLVYPAHEDGARLTLLRDDQKRGDGHPARWQGAHPWREGVLAGSGAPAVCNHEVSHPPPQVLQEGAEALARFSYPSIPRTLTRIMTFTYPGTPGGMPVSSTIFLLSSSTICSAVRCMSLSFLTS